MAENSYAEYMQQQTAAGMSTQEANIAWANMQSGGKAFGDTSGGGSGSGDSPWSGGGSGDEGGTSSSITDTFGAALDAIGGVMEEAETTYNNTNTQYGGFTGTYIQEFDNDDKTDTPSYAQWREGMDDSVEQLTDSITNIENKIINSGNNISKEECQELKDMLSKLQDTKADLVATQSAVDAIMKDVKNADDVVNGMILDFDAEGLRVSAYTYMSSNNAGGFTTDKNEGGGTGSKGVNIFNQSYQKHGFGEGNEYTPAEGGITMTDITMAVDTDDLNELRRTINGGTTGCLDDAFTILSQLTGKEDYKASYNGGSCEKCTFDFTLVKAQIDDGKPVIIHVGGPLKTHWVAVTGYKGGCNSLADLIAIDNWGTNNSGGGEYDGGYWDEKGDYHAGKSELVLGADALAAKNANGWYVYSDMYIYNP